MMGDAIRFVACHEVGHSLGLRHNMMGSWTFPTDSLRSKSFTDKMNSTASSIMDYARYNYVAQPGDGVTAVSPHIGPYDILPSNMVTAGMVCLLRKLKKMCYTIS